MSLPLYTFLGCIVGVLLFGGVLFLLRVSSAGRSAVPMSRSAADLADAGGLIPAAISHISLVLQTARYWQADRLAGPNAVAHAHTYLKTLRYEIEQLQTFRGKNEVLRNLAQYATHLPNCAKTRPYDGPDASRECDCAYDEWIARWKAVSGA